MVTPSPSSPAASPKPRRRWYQFSLRTLLILITVFSFAAASVGTWIYYARSQRVIVESLVRSDQLTRKHGQRISVIYEDGYSTSDSNARIKSSWIRSNLLRVLGRDYVFDVVEIKAKNLPHDSIIKQSDYQLTLEQLTKLPNLRSVTLPIEVDYNERETLELASRLNHLNEINLDINGVSLNSEFVENLKRVPNLNRLTIDYVQTQWRVVNDRFPSVDIRLLNELPQLKELELNIIHFGGGQKPDEIKNLTRLTKLRKLTIRSSSFNVDVAQSLVENFPSLEELRIYENAPQIEHVAILNKHRSLKKLHFECSYHDIGDDPEKVKAEFIRKLRTVIPTMEIEVEMWTIEG